MARQVRDKHGSLWIASNLGPQPLGTMRVGNLPIELGNASVDRIAMERLGTDQKLLASLPHGRWAEVTDGELREALEHALALYPELEGPPPE